MPDNDGADRKGRTKMSKAEAGRKGGRTTKARYGDAFYQRIGKEGGQKGGRTTAERHGPDHFRRIGAKGGRGKRKNKGGS